MMKGSGLKYSRRQLIFSWLGGTQWGTHPYAALYTEILDAHCVENISPVRLHPGDEWHSLPGSDQAWPAGFTGGTRRRTRGGSSTQIPQKLLLSKGLILSCGASFYVPSDGGMCVNTYCKQVLIPRVETCSIKAWGLKKRLRERNSGFLPHGSRRWRIQGAGLHPNMRICRSDWWKLLCYTDISTKTNKHNRRSTQTVPWSTCRTDVCAHQHQPPP